MSLVTVDGDVVYLEVSPERIIREIRGHVQKMPVEYRPASVVRELSQAPDNGDQEASSPKANPAAKKKAPKKS